MIMDIKQKTAETYDKIASGYSAGHFAHFWIEEFAFYKSIIDGKKVIDLGCGAGRDAAVFVENGFDYTGIDASEGMLKVASERVPKGKFQKMDFSKTIFQNGEFDGFWAAASPLHILKKMLPVFYGKQSELSKTAALVLSRSKRKMEWMKE